MTLRVLFDDHGTVDLNDMVADLDIEWLISEADGLSLERTTEVGLGFDRAMLHLAKEELKDLLDRTAPPVFALLVTTDAGVPLERQHEVREGVVVLAVRRMSAFQDPDAWRAFLQAGPDVLLAVAQDRLEDVPPASRAMLPLFTTRDDWIRTLGVLCRIHQESMGQAAGTQPPARGSRVRAELRDARYWHSVLQKLPIGPCDAVERLPDVAANEPEKTERLMLRELWFEGATPLGTPEVLRLACAIARGEPITEEIVNPAADGLARLLR